MIIIVICTTYDTFMINNIILFCFFQEIYTLVILFHSYNKSMNSFTNERDLYENISYFLVSDIRSHSLIIRHLTFHGYVFSMNYQVSCS